MDVILKVLEGAKTGTKIAVKKDEFLIGRSQECHLCAGSSSISRRHCMIARDDTKVSIKDLGSRNGTLVNGEKITETVELSSGDELGIGTLKLMVTISHGINNRKRPKVETVADAVERTVATGDSNIGEDDITQWLLDSPDAASKSQAANETQTIRMDETNAVQFKGPKRAEEAETEAETEAEIPEPTSDETASDSKVESPTQPDDETAADSKKKSKKKREPGKLPPRPTEPASKDSREAAMMALRNWNRRR